MSSLDKFTALSDSIQEYVSCDLGIKNVLCEFSFVTDFVVVYTLIPSGPGFFYKKEDQVCEKQTSIFTFVNKQIFEVFFRDCEEQIRWRLYNKDLIYLGFKICSVSGKRLLELVI